jgi:hypothetical protein
MAENAERYTVRIHQEPGHELWAEVHPAVTRVPSATGTGLLTWSRLSESNR